MKDKVMIFFFVCLVILLLFLVLYQQFIYRKGIKAKLKEISRKLFDIIENDSDEKIMIFTDNKVIMDLCGQINHLLLNLVTILQ